MVVGFTLLGALLGGPMPQDKPAAPVIEVLAVGVVETPPEIATLTYDVRGEGKSPDDATRAMTERKAAVEESFAALGDAKIEIRTGEMHVEEVRGRDCRGEDGDDEPRLSTGPCAIIGYVARIGLTAKVKPASEAGTLAGLAARAGADNVSLEDFDIIDVNGARGRAIQIAVANGTRQAEAIAAASGRKLGELVRVIDGDARDLGGKDIVVTGSRRGMVNRLPIRVDLAPKPVSTVARLTLTFEIAP